MIEMCKKSQIYKDDFGYFFVHLLAFENEKKGENECINVKEVIETRMDADILFYCLTIRKFILKIIFPH